MQVLAVGLAAAGGTALIAASCLDRKDAAASLTEPAYVETTSATTTTTTAQPSSTDSSSGPSVPPVNITVNNTTLPAGTTIVTSSESPTAGHASHAANDPAQYSSLQQQQPLVSGAPIVAGGVAPGFNAAPAGVPYVDQTGVGSSTVANDGGVSNQGGGAGSIGSGGGQTPNPSPTFSTDWGPAGSGYVTPNPNMGAGAFSNGNTPR